MEENVIRKFTGWNDIQGRVNTPSSNAVLAKAQKHAMSMTNLKNVQILNNQPTAYKNVIEITCHGNGFLTAGMALKLLWHVDNPNRPLDESLPSKIVITSIAHYYSAQKYYCRLRGAVPLEATN